MFMSFKGKKVLSITGEKNGATLFQFLPKQTNNSEREGVACGGILLTFVYFFPSVTLHVLDYYKFHIIWLWLLHNDIIMVQLKILRNIFFLKLYFLLASKYLISHYLIGNFQMFLFWKYSTKLTQLQKVVIQFKDLNRHLLFRHYSSSDDLWIL